MRICNRKLAKRIAENEAALIKLVTERQFDPTADFLEVKRAIFATDARIKRDKETLAAHGYDVEGRKMK